MEGIEYIPVGDYLLPALIVDEPLDGLAEPITRYGSIRRRYLREHSTITYNRLLLTGRLFQHLREIQRKAHERFEQIMSEMQALYPPPDKETDGIAWANHMAEIHRNAEKLMLDEVIYT